MKRLLAWHVLAFAACVFASVARARADDAIVRDGNYRITVITPNLVRIEQSDSNTFIDDPSLFAVSRDARYTQFKHDAPGEIDTGAIQLSTKNGLHARIRNGDKWVDWTPESKNTRNLGGTLRTLDGVSKPVDLGEGLLSRDGWAVIDDSKSPLFTKDWVKPRPKDAGSDIYLFGYGSDYRAALKSLAAIAGPVPMPRRYMLGVWYSRYWNYTADEFKQIVKEYDEHKFPLDVMVMDMDWHLTQVPGASRAYANQVWTGYTWDKALIPDPDGLLKWFHEKGLHVTLNDHPADGVQPHEEMYADFMRAMGEDPSLKKTIPFDAGDQKYLDTFWKLTHQNQIDRGVDFWWLDWQKYPNTRSIAELTNLWWLNHYYYQHTASNNQRGASFSRWAGNGDHRHPIHFSGDAATNWATLAFEVPFTATAGNVGCFFWSHDIGGHMGGRNEESYTRWCQFGALTAALRSHSTRDASMDRRPWAYPKWAEDSMRTSFGLRSQLFPYIYSAVAQSTREMVPLNRPMYFDWPSDKRAYQNPQQFMFGDDLLVAPIASPGTGPGRIAKQVVWFPPGSTWFNVFTGEKFDGGGNERIVVADINEFPLYARGGVPIAMQPYTPRMGTAPLGELIVRVYPGEENVTHDRVLYEDDGVSVAYSRGDVATTTLRAQRMKGETRVTVGKTRGTYSGQPTARTIVIELPCTERVTQMVRVDGFKPSMTFDAETRTNRVRIPNVPIDRELAVTVKCDFAEENGLQDVAAARRREGAGVSEELEFALHGVGLADVFRNPTMTGAPERRFYVAYGGIDRIHVSVRDETGAVLAQPREVPVVEGSAVIPPPADDLPISDKRRSVVVDFEELGKRYAFQRALPYDVRVLKRETNIAKDATITVSSTEERYGTAGATDGIVDGYPSAPKSEWASKREKAGAWIKLEWKQPHTIDSILLFDRINGSDGIDGATIEFDDGSKLDVGELPNDGSEPLTLRFPPKTIRSLKLTITRPSKSTWSAGISEIAVYRAEGKR